MSPHRLRYTLRHGQTLRNTPKPPHTDRFPDSRVRQRPSDPAGNSLADIGHD